MYAFTKHFPHDSHMVMINKYMYTVFFAEPALDDPSRSKNLFDVHHAATKFLGIYFMHGSKSLKVTSTQMMELIDLVFPDLFDYLKDTGLFGAARPVATDAALDYDSYSYHLAVLIPLDWLSIYQTCELEERRRGRAIRYVQVYDRRSCLYFNHFMFLETTGSFPMMATLCPPLALANLHVNTLMASW